MLSANTGESQEKNMGFHLFHHVNSILPSLLGFSIKAVAFPNAVLNVKELGGNVNMYYPYNTVLTFFFIAVVLLQ